MPIRRKLNPRAARCEICILAGGLSRRMGSDKARLRIGRRTMLGHIRASAKATGFPVRVICRDLVPRCGPIGGIYTALITTHSEIVMFLACDMPLIRAELMQFLLGRLRPKQQAAFLSDGNDAGFPLVLRRATSAVVAEQIGNREFSLHALAKVLNAGIIKAPAALAFQLRNVNTPAEWRRLRRLSKD